MLVLLDLNKLEKTITEKLYEVDCQAFRCSLDIGIDKINELGKNMEDYPQNKKDNRRLRK